MDAQQRFNKKRPVVCFRVDPKIKETIRKFGAEQEILNDDGSVNVSNTVKFIVDDYFRINEVMVIKYESKYDGRK